jgi:hemin uptake protein HemP
MAAKSKSATATKKSDAQKAADRKALAVEQVHIRSLTDPENSVIVLDVDGTEYTLNEQTLLNLRREVNEIAAGFVH